MLYLGKSKKLIYEIALARIKDFRTNDCNNINVNYHIDYLIPFF